MRKFSVLSPSCRQKGYSFPSSLLHIFILRTNSSPSWLNIHITIPHPVAEVKPQTSPVYTSTYVLLLKQYGSGSIPCCSLCYLILQKLTKTLRWILQDDQNWCRMFIPSLWVMEWLEDQRLEFETRLSSGPCLTFIIIFIFYKQLYKN